MKTRFLFQTPVDADGDSISAQASDWVIAVADDPGKEDACRRWRAADPAHEEAWLEAMELWHQAGALGSLEREDWRAEIEALSTGPARRPAFFARREFAIAATIVLMVLGTIALWPTREQQLVTTAIAQVKRLELPDGSHMTLGAQSAANIRFSDDKREVVLDKGQAFFEVAHDAERPFTVVAGEANVRVTGTKFDVRRDNEDIQIAVKEGRVEVRRRDLLSTLGLAKPDVILTARYRTELSPGADSFTPRTISPYPAGDWRNGRFYYSEAPLSEIMADIARYSDVPVRIGDRSLATMRLTTSFRTDAIADFLKNVEMVLPVRQVHLPDGSIVLETSSQKL